MRVAAHRVGALEEVDRRALPCRDGIADGRLEPAPEVEDDIRLRDLTHLAGSQLELVRFDTRRGEIRDGGRRPGGLPGRKGKGIERGDDATTLARVRGLPAAAGRERQHENTSDAKENHSHNKSGSLAGSSAANRFRPGDRGPTGSH